MQTNYMSKIVPIVSKYVRISLLVLFIICGSLMSLLARNVRGQEVLDKALTVSFKNETHYNASERTRRQTDILLFYTVNVINMAEKTNNKIKVISLEGSSTSIDISGRVMSSSGEYLAGVTVQVKGGSAATKTDTDGFFRLSVSENSVLIFTYVGFISEEIPVAGRSSFDDIVLKPIDTRMEEVVVVGYGTQRKVASTAAVSTIKGDELAQAPVANFSSSIAGKLSGVSMRPNGGQPGYDNPDIHVRGIATTGNNSALIVVDGIIRKNINEIDPQSIATVTILKDAAAVAPYGLGGANGVILITTKRGTTGEPTLSFNAYYGDQQPTYIPNPLSAQDYMRLRNEAYLNDNPGLTQIPFPEELISDYTNLNKNDPDKYPISNATKDVVKYHAPMQEAGLQISGGTKNLKYYGGIGYFNQKGMFDPVGYSRITYNLNIDVNATNTTTVSLSINGAEQTTNNIDAASSTGQLFRATYKLIPITNLYYSNGLWGEFAGNTPVGVLNSGGYFRENKSNFLSTIAIEQKLPFIKGLSIKGTFSYDPFSYTQKGWHRPFYYYSVDLTTSPYTYTRQISSQEGGAATYTWLNQSYFQNNSFTYQGFLNYHNSFGKHDITGLVVAEEKNNKQLNFSASRDNFAVDIDELSLGSSNRQDFNNSGSSSTGSQIGLVYRVGYGYDNRYFLEASGRYDGHYYFAPQRRWGYFPAFSAGWILSNETFMNTLANIDFLKLRGSWGKSGNLAGSAFQYLSGYTLYGNAYAYGSGLMTQGSYISQEANPNITWEVSAKTDIGFEAAFWNGLLRLEADYFVERRSGMLLPPAITVPVEYGLALSDENAGIMKNRGIEIVAGSQKSLKNGLRLGLNANFSYARNRMVQVFESGVTRNDPRRSRTGKQLSTPFGYQSLGLFSTTDDKNGDGVIDAADGYNILQFGALHPGDIRYADLSGPDGVPDGKIDSYDETQVGNPVYPAITYGLTTNANWKGFDLELFFQGSAISSLDIKTFQTIPFNNNNSSSTYEYYNNRWTPEHQNALYPRANQSPYSNNTQSSNFWFLNTGFLRLKTAVLGYTVPIGISKKAGMKNLRFYVTGQNIFTMSKLKFMDPEVGYSGKETAYPTQKVFIFGLSTSF